MGKADVDPLGSKERVVVKHGIGGLVEVDRDARAIGDDVVSHDAALVLPGLDHPLPPGAATAERQADARAADMVPRANDEVAVEQAVRRVALHERPIADSITGVLSEIHEQVGPNDPAVAADNIDEGDGFDRLPHDAVGEPIALDEHMIGPHHPIADPPAAAFDHRAELAQSVVSDDRVVCAIDDMKGKAAPIVAFAYPLDVEVLEDPMSPAETKSFHGVELERDRAKALGAHRDGFFRRAVGAHVEALSGEPVCTVGNRDHVAGCRFAEGSEQALGAADGPRLGGHCRFVERDRDPAQTADDGERDQSHRSSGLQKHYPSCAFAGRLGGTLSGSWGSDNKILKLCRNLSPPAV